MDVESILGMSLMTFVMLVVIVAALVAAYWYRDVIKSSYESWGSSGEQAVVEQKQE